MSSLRNAVKRKTHKERSQPASRRQYGLLEKKKDYLLRAKDFHKKEKAIQDLRQKAQERNPDEFYFAMQSRQTRGGIDVGRDTANKYSQSELRLMKTQDIGYISLKAQTEARRLDKLRSSLHCIGSSAPATHIVFADDEAAVREFQAEQYFDVPAELLGRTYNRPRTAQLTAAAALHSSEQLDSAAQKSERRRTQLYSQLAQRAERQQTLESLASRLNVQKQAMRPGRKRKVSNGTNGAPALFRWKRERLT